MMLRIVGVLGAVVLFVAGMAVFSATRSDPEPGTDVEAATEITGGLDPDAYPHLVEMAADHVLRPGYDHAGEFDWGLEIVLEGLERTARDA